MLLWCWLHPWRTKNQIELVLHKFRAPATVVFSYFIYRVFVFNFKMNLPKVVFFLLGTTILMLQQVKADVAYSEGKLMVCKYYYNQNNLICFLTECQYWDNLCDVLKSTLNENIDYKKCIDNSIYYLSPVKSRWTMARFYCQSIFNGNKKADLLYANNVSERNSFGVIMSNLRNKPEAGKWDYLQFN